MSVGVNDVVWSVPVINVSIADGSFRFPLPDNRHSVLPPNLPVRSVMQEQTGGSRLISDIVSVRDIIVKLTLLADFSPAILRD